MPAQAPVQAALYLLRCSSWAAETPGYCLDCRFRGNAPLSLLRFVQPFSPTDNRKEPLHSAKMFPGLFARQEILRNL